MKSAGQTKINLEISVTSTDYLHQKI